jgi:hypothetical protein
VPPAHALSPRLTLAWDRDTSEKREAGLLGACWSCRLSVSQFEPPAPVEIERIPLSSGQEILVLRASYNLEAMPFTYDGRAYQRIGTTTSVMPQETYQRLLLERAHARQRLGESAVHGSR